MTAASYAIEMTDRSRAAPGESDVLSVLVLYAGDPVGAVTITWHGDLELELNASKFFGGRSPGIENAWQLADLVRRAVEARCPKGISQAAHDVFDPDGETLAWEIAPADDGGRANA